MILKKTFSVNKSSFYELNITLDSDQEYKKGIIKIINDITGTQIFLSIKLPNTIFSINNNNNSRQYVIYFNTPDDIDLDTVTMYILCLDISCITINNISCEQMFNKINLIKLRHLNDIEFTKYYLDLFIKHSNKKLDTKLIQKINDEYLLFKEINYFQKFIDTRIDQNCKNLDKYKHIIDKIYNKITILFLTSSIHDESPSTNRIKSIAKAINFDATKYYCILCTKYGYPYDNPEEYYNKKLNLNKIDGIDYLTLCANKDNFNTNTLISYLEKYITELLKECKMNTINIIHVQNSYLNAIAAAYVAKKLNIKFIYDININEWINIDNKNMMSDMMTLRINLEKQALQLASQIIVSSYCYDTYNKLFQLDNFNNVTIIPFGIDTNKFKENKDNIIKIKNMIQTVHSSHSKLINTLRTELLNPQKTNIIYNPQKTTNRLFLGNGITFNQNADKSSEYTTQSNEANKYENKFSSNLQPFVYNSNNNDGEHNTYNKQKIIYRQKITESVKPNNNNVIYSNQTTNPNNQTSEIIASSKIILGYFGPLEDNRGIEKIIESVSIASKDHHIIMSCVIINDNASNESTNDQNYIKKLLSLIISLDLEKHVTIITDVSEHLKWAYVDYVNVFYFDDFQNIYDYDTVIQKLLAKGKLIITSNKFYDKFMNTLNEGICIKLDDTTTTNLTNAILTNNFDKKHVHSLRNYVNSHFSIMALCNKLYDIYDTEVIKNDNRKSNDNISI